MACSAKGCAKRIELWQRSKCLFVCVFSIYYVVPQKYKDGEWSPGVGENSFILTKTIISTSQFTSNPPNQLTHYIHVCII